MTKKLPCPCNSGDSYAACCGLFIDGGQRPATAEQLMRARYSAYTLMREYYLLRTWHPSTRPAELGLVHSAPAKWLALKILRTEAGDSHDTHGVVEFVARYKVNGRAERLHEVSRFTQEDGQWFYVDGAIDPTKLTCSGATMKRQVIEFS